MSDVFLSYARTDRTAAARVADILRAKGWSVWWDSRIGGGEAWESVIERELVLASCVVVIWSENSVESYWVKSEAADGFERRILVPVRIDDVALPVFYRAIQTIDLKGALTNPSDPALTQFIEAVGAVVRRAALTRGVAQRAAVVQADDTEPATSGAAGGGRLKQRRVSPAVRKEGRTRKLPSGLRSVLTARVNQPALVNLFVHLHPGAKARYKPAGEVPGMALYRGARLSSVSALAADSDVTAVELADPVAPGFVQVGSYQARRPRSDDGASRKHGEVLLGIVDIGGFDFAHPDFSDATGTRFVRIWDQGGNPRPAPGRFGYGSELTQEVMNRAIRSAARAGLEPQELEPQSSMVPSARATHMASVAGGNSGVCPRAHLAGVLLPSGRAGSVRVALDSACIADAVSYLFNLGMELRLPVSVVLGVGTESAANHGGSGVARWLDVGLTTAGRYVTVGANTAEQLTSYLLHDSADRFRQVHTSGTIRESGLTERIEWVVNGNGVVDLCENGLHIWYAPQDRFAIAIKPPGSGWIGPIELGESLEHHLLEHGADVSIYHEQLPGAGEGNYIACYLRPLVSEDAVGGLAAGMWTVRLFGRTVRDGGYHGWVMRSAPPWAEHGGQGLPAHFSARSAVPGFAVNGVAGAGSVLTVANLDHEHETIHPASARGPTWDGRHKPDVAAPGTELVGANGFDSPNPPWIAMSGSPVAAAFAAGVAAQMLARNPELTSRAISQIIRTTAIPLPGADYGWHDDAGFGVIDAAGCLSRVESRRR